MADLYSLVHRETGPVETYLTESVAQRELWAVLRDEPGWAENLWSRGSSSSWSKTSDG